MPGKTFWIIDRIRMACAILAILIVVGSHVIIGKRIIEGPPILETSIQEPGESHAHGQE